MLPHRPSKDVRASSGRTHRTVFRADVHERRNMAKSVGDFVSGRRLPRAIDRDIFRQQGSAIDYGDRRIATHDHRKTSG
ncbi:hypothetical protein D0U02_15065 [Burkholderia pseudomallei]|uniref:Uncharacterized protein n=1 Tax=Burkholderia pseudomallei (strain K96243) TaxID=272560 RepID=Q63WX0_BURPS|nr:hypothetical protein D0U05_13900 [Burkholderia pseudomallei]RFS62019.1 hypothetical protein D0U02_15065 [Burkholderia pseudomallei]RFS70130.1 hypothetical protein D0U01_06065 [Burkholderia pseudomallei]RFS72926.1 hypothetical protein D0T98_18740 [Burkholderia pseudomallei]CAH34763.1 hypothetical protein BPSL0771 [Burkholderia pseudomallei K96243]